MIRGNDGANAPVPYGLADKLPPQNLEAEQETLGAVFLDNSVLPDLAVILPDPGMFYRNAHQILWRVILDLFHEGFPVDLVTVIERLRVSEQVHDIGGEDYVYEVIQRTPHSASARHHAWIIKSKAALRDTIETLNGALNDAYAAHLSSSDIMTAAMDRLRKIDEQSNPDTSLRAGDLIDEVLDRIRRRQTGELVGLPTGFSELDGLTGCLQPEDFVLIAARPSMGKTSFAMNIIEHTSVNLGNPALVVSLEMGNPALLERMLACRSEVPLKTIRSGAATTTSQNERMGQSAIEIGNAPVYLLRRASRAVNEVCNEIRRHHARHGIALAVVDYVQLMHTDNPRESEVSALTRISAALKGVAGDCGVPIIGLSQLNRNQEIRGKDDRRPKLSDLRGSGALEQDADIALFLHRPEWYDPKDRPGEADAIMLKNRNGPVGEFKLYFDAHLTRFRDFIPPLTHRAADAPF